MKRTCSSCAKKIEKKYNYCPYCGVSFKQLSEQENYGFLGRDDITNMMQNNQSEVKLPFGLNKIVDSLVKQLEKQMGELNVEDAGMGKDGGRGFKIKISTGNQGPQLMEEPQKQTTPIQEEIPKTEQKRRNQLPKIEAQSHIKRLSDRIIYEITAPGIRGKKDVVLNELATGIEVRAYAREACYIKHIPIKVEIIDYYLEKDKLYVECKA